MSCLVDYLKNANIYVDKAKNVCYLNDITDQIYMIKLIATLSYF